MLCSGCVPSGEATILKYIYQLFDISVGHRDNVTSLQLQFREPIALLSFLRRDYPACLNGQPGNSVYSAWKLFGNIHSPRKKNYIFVKPHLLPEDNVE